MCEKELERGLKKNEMDKLKHKHKKTYRDNINEIIDIARDEMFEAYKKRGIDIDSEM